MSLKIIPHRIVDKLDFSDPRFVIIPKLTKVEQVDGR